MKQVLMTGNYTPKADPYARSLYAGSRYPVSDEVADEVELYGYGHVEAEGSGEVAATEAAKKEAAERGIDLKKVKGSGADGQVTKDDVKKEDS